ncbi:MAG: hypothetical protein DRP00_06035 [Candidatus Aenigmatarchaeota archaeon]|nr:MAG: hypothetical protein DRP00_06035 [Candidatus Aenigmarchaeota archaeon]
MSDGMDEAKGFMKGFIFGGLLGAGLLLFYAPRSGEETRKIVREEIEKVIAKGKGFSESLKEKGEELKAKAEELKAKGKKS